jgi:helix-turn-helix protein
MAIHPGLGVDAEYMTVRDARLETPRVLVVTFTNDHEARFPVASLPFASSTDAEEVQILADGDVLQLLSTAGDFKVTADELWGMLRGTIGSREVARLVGQNLRTLRIEMGLSLRDVEALSGIAAPNVHTLESGETTPRLDTLGRLAEAYRVPVARLVTRQ